MNIKNISYNRFETIDCEYEHPEFGWIPYTADPNDVEQLSRDIYVEATNGNHVIAPYVPPPQQIPQAVSPRQIRQALTRFDLRTQVEAAVAAGDQDLKDWWEFSTVVERNHPMVVGMATALGISDHTLDAIFLAAGTL